MEDGVEGETRGAGRSPAAEVATRGASTPSSSTRRSIVVVEDEATVRTPSTPSWVRTRYHAANSASARSATALATRLRERLLRAIARKTRARASRPSDATAGVGVVASVKTTTSADIIRAARTSATARVSRRAPSPRHRLARGSRVPSRRPSRARDSPSGLRHRRARGRRVSLSPDASRWFGSVWAPAARRPANLRRRIPRRRRPDPVARANHPVPSTLCRSPSRARPRSSARCSTSRTRARARR